MRQQNSLFNPLSILFLLLCAPMLQASAGTASESHIRATASTPAAKTPAPAAKTPAAAPAPIDLPSIMSKKGCGTFAGLLNSVPDAAGTFANNIDGGLTAFCPLDHAMKPFLAKFKNLTADGKLSLLLYHAFPVYYSMAMLKIGNGVVNTLATDGTSKNYNITVQNEGNQVTLKTASTVASIVATLLDKDPVAAYSIDQVLQPAELFKPAEALAPAPAPEAPKKKKAPKGKKSAKASPPAPAGPDEQPADQAAADESPATMNRVGWRAAAAIAAAAAAVMMA